jgi:hypothetical protein
MVEKRVGIGMDYDPKVKCACRGNKRGYGFRASDFLSPSKSFLPRQKERSAKSDCRVEWVVDSTLGHK